MSTLITGAEVPQTSPEEIRQLQEELERISEKITTMKVDQNLDDLQGKTLENGYENRQEKRDKTFWEKVKDVFKGIGDTIMKVVDWTVIKPAKLVSKFVMKHPAWALIIALALVVGGTAGALALAGKLEQVLTVAGEGALTAYNEATKHITYLWKNPDAISKSIGNPGKF